MWEAIRANRRRSVLLITALLFVLVALGGVIGGATAPDFWPIGIAAALVIWLILLGTAFAAGRSILLSAAGAREISHADAPQLFNVVEEMCIAAGLRKVPKVYIVDNDAPNAFAVGTPANSAVACTTGLLIRLNRDELQGVVAHEIGHIVNEDTKFLTHAGVMVAAIVLLSDLFLRGTGRASRGSRRRSGGGQAQAILLVAAVIFALLAPFLAQALYFACSRRREYLADASSARFTRYPEGLASALEKIGSATVQMESVSRATAPMYTVNPRPKSDAFSLFATHPPLQRRIAVLRNMTKGADFSAYNEAFRHATGEESIVGRRTLAQCRLVGIRPPSQEPEKDEIEKERETVDILHRINGMLFVACSCGLKTKLPQSFKDDVLYCARCGAANPIPRAAPAVAAVATAIARSDAPPPPSPGEARKSTPKMFKYTPGQWQSFRCSCGRTIQLSPVFRAPQVHCPKCRSEIRIERI